MKRHEVEIIKAEKQEEDIPPPEIDPAQLSKDLDLYKATQKGDQALVLQLIQTGADVFFQNPEDGLRTPLHLAAANGNAALVQLLLEYGAPWNTVDEGGKTTGEYALAGGHREAYEVLLNAGIRAELILNCVTRKHSSGVANEDFLSQKLVYDEEAKSLVDAEGHGIMMGWESPIMAKHAELIAPRPGLDVLNVGFGMGIIDRHLSARSPATHTIIEAHPDVYAYMLREGWDKKPGVRIVFGRWQEVLGELGQYDGIFFDTFGEFYEDLREFHEELPGLLKRNGVYSFFNGLAGTNGFFHDVYCQIVDLEMRELGFKTEYVREGIDVKDKVWEGINGKYFQLNYYNYPIVTWMEEEGENEDFQEEKVEEEEKVITSVV